MKKFSTTGNQTAQPLSPLNVRFLCLTVLLTPFDCFRLKAQPCNNTTVLSITGPSTSTWTAPQTGGPFEVRISATGASGGAYLEANPDRTGGTGATMSGTFIVQNGQTLRAVAGGGGHHSQLEGGGGGGGSGAVNCGNPSHCADGVVLIIAAGGNGGQLGGPNNGYGAGGSNDTNGDGEGGQTTTNNDSGGGGGGLNSPGESAPSGGAGGGQVSKTGLASGGQGSSNMTSNPPSGFNHGGPGMGGGGGGGDGGTPGVDNASGGGGGHSGADGGNVNQASSFNSGENPANSHGIMGGGSTGAPSNPSNPGTVSFVCLGVVLPVKLIDFKAVVQKGHVVLHWSTAAEKHNHGYDVEHSTDGRHWSALGFVPGHGTTSLRHDYSLTDEKPHPGINYYRLKQIDTDGRFEHSPMVVADVHSHRELFDIFPNPSITGELSVRMVSKTKGDALLEIFDWAGYKVWKEKRPLFEGTTVWPLSMTTFPKGAYTARLEMPDGSLQFKKILLQ